MRALLQKRFPRVTAWLHRHQRHLPTAALLVGFLWDWLTLGRPDGVFDNAVLLFYVILAGFTIILLSIHRERGRGDSLGLRTLLQFSFGNMTSALFVLYSISGTITGNWLFFAALAAVLIGNEVIGERHGQLRFNMAFYYLLVLAYFVLVTPVVFSQMGENIFLVAVVSSIGFVVVYGVLLNAVAPRIVSQSSAQVGAAILAIFVGFTTLYFSDLVPPVPLALRDAGVYHELQRVDGTYRLSYVPGAWYEVFRSGDDVIYKTDANDRAYCFSSVFAPTGLSAPVVHHWQRYDSGAEQWRTHSKVPFSITGGRDDGYRGFSYVSALSEGEWRCRVETERGVLIGRTMFSVVAASTTPELITDVR